MKKKSFKNKTYYIYGKHPTLAAIANSNRIIHEILIIKENLHLIPDKFHKISKIISNAEFAKILPKESIHQGLAVLVSQLKNQEINSLNIEDNTKIAILDQITDPHNLGAILRSASAFGIGAVILPYDNSPEENAIIAKTSCGALEQVQIFRVTNISATINQLKKSNFWVIGLEGEANEEINAKLLEGRICIVLGAEGKGMRRLTKEHCDKLVKIPMESIMESLNVSNAAAIAFFTAYLAKRK